jgi:DHA2 family lincomycin resistance protein-like MFS transporter
VPEGSQSRRPQTRFFLPAGSSRDRTPDRAAAAGPPLSGIIVEWLGWRGIFLVLLPVSLAVLVLGATTLRNLTTIQLRIRVDGWSALLATVAFGGLIYGISTVGETPHALPSWIPTSVGLLSLVFFINRQLLRQHRGRTPLLDLRPFASPRFLFGSVVICTSILAQTGTMALLPLLMQDSLGFDARDSGLLLLPGGLIIGILALPVGHLYDRIGPRPLILPGTLITSASLFAFGLMADRTPSPLAIASLYVALNIGIGATMAPVMSAALGSLTPRQYPHGSAITSTLQPLVAAVAVALFIGIMTNALAEDPAGQIVSASGSGTAFLVGGAISLAGVVAATFIGGVRSARQGIQTPSLPE